MIAGHTDSEEAIPVALEGHRGSPRPSVPGTDLGITLSPEESLTPLQILLADDHHMLRRHVRAILEEAGFDIVGEASDGREAVRLAQRFRPDMVILDMSMPALNGFEAAQQILQQSPQTRAILLTVHAERAYVRKAIRIGIRGYVVKAEMPDGLLAAIEAVSRGSIYQSPTLSESVDLSFLTRADPPAYLPSPA